ncbi:hypothetical protein H9636_01380 [Ureibacillus sp. Re31]|uniref:YfhD-like protein n=1 Tax=Ureibacillus galli TaxID=2762222 RepID=A0ABR8X7J8_9BACL|nr:hypothetical protein [Ureibacillus galli]MBD8025298.1 hypothetical protein [Ureibacillus galli]
MSKKNDAEKEAQLDFEKRLSDPGKPRKLSKEEVEKLRKEGKTFFKFSLNLSK